MSRERRPLFLPEEESAEPGRYGCPMIARIRQSSLLEVAGPKVRCAFGWALHDELDVARCAATDFVTDCWKAHPERTPVVVLPGAEVGEVESDMASKHVAGD